MNKWISLRIYTLILLFCTVCPTHAQESGYIKIRTIDVLPYGIKTDTNSSGIYYDIANLLAKEAGYKVNNYIYPYARIIFELKSGKTDMTIMFKYKELEEFVIYIAPLPTLKTVVIGPRGTTFDSLNSLKGKRVGYLRGAKFSDAVDNDPDIIAIETIDFIQALRMLMIGRVDAIIGPMTPILSAAADLHLGNDFFGKPFIVDERTPWVQISRKSVDRISTEKLRAVFNEINKRGELEKIRNKYTKISITY